MIGADRRSGRRACLGLLLAAWVGLAAAAPAQTLPEFAEVRASARASVGVLLARDGTPLADRRVDEHTARLEWVALSSFSPALREALLAAEDKRFFEHSGVDWRAFVGALWHNLWYDHKRGASTLTMQVAGLLDPALALGRNGLPRRSIGQKWDQALAARTLEAHWTKEQILEAYLNLAPFRGDLQGVHAAARVLFGKTPAELGRPESLILAVLLRGPNASPEVVARRACVLAQSIQAPAACAPAQKLAQTQLARTSLMPRWELAPHAARFLVLHPGERVRSTLDAEAQRLVLNALRRLGTPDAAAVVLDNPSGEVLAYVGAPEPRLPDALLGARALPVLLQPFAYAQALDKRQLTAVSLLEDSLANRAPTLPDDRSWVSVRRALAEALPDPALAVLRQGGEGLQERWRQMELEPPRHGGWPEPSLLQLAAGYRSLASGGHWIAPHFVAGGTADKGVRRVWRTETSFVLGELLLDQDEDGRPLPHVLRSQGAEGRDWVLAGFSDRYTLVLRVQPPRGAVGFQPQAVWRDLLAALHRGQPELRPLPPPGVVSQVVAFEPPLESARREWFMRGTEVERVFFPQPAKLQLAPPPRILQPQGGALVDVSGKADDPAFRLGLEASAMPPGCVWRLDGVVLGNSARLGWRPLGGRHVLELLGPDGQVLDSITFAVRGAPSASEPAQ